MYGAIRKKIKNILVLGEKDSKRSSTVIPLVLFISAILISSFVSSVIMYPSKPAVASSPKAMMAYAAEEAYRRNHKIDLDSYQTNLHPHLLPHPPHSIHGLTGDPRAGNL